MKVASTIDLYKSRDLSLIFRCSLSLVYCLFKAWRGGGERGGPGREGRYCPLPSPPPSPLNVTREDLFYYVIISPITIMLKCWLVLHPNQTECHSLIHIRWHNTTRIAFSLFINSSLTSGNVNTRFVWFNILFPMIWCEFQEFISIDLLIELHRIDRC